MVANVLAFTLWQKVKQLGRTTDKNIVPESKSAQGVEFCKNKFSLTGLSCELSKFVTPLRIEEYPLQAE